MQDKKLATYSQTSDVLFPILATLEGIKRNANEVTQKWKIKPDLQNMNLWLSNLESPYSCIQFHKIHYSLFPQMRSGHISKDHDLRLRAQLV